MNQNTLVKPSRYTSVNEKLRYNFILFITYLHVANDSMPVRDSLLLSVFQIESAGIITHSQFAVTSDFKVVGKERA